jgi:uncharacterized protein YgbK (DUF1537 family)
VGEAADASDLQFWANRLDRKTIPAGAAEFFSAFLSTGGYPSQAETSTQLTPGDTTLFVCGSTSASARRFCQQCEAAGIPVLRMPLEILGSTSPASELIQDWATSAVQAIKHHPRVLVAIDRPMRQDDGLSQRLTTYLSTVVEFILNRSSIDHLLVEGGATAATLIQRLNWQKMRVKYEFAPGVVCMQVVGERRPLLTMKPGSYIWPDDV